MSGPPTISQRLALAIEHHVAGRLADADVLYRGILEEAPQHAEALHLLGTLAHQSGNHWAAIDLIRRALAVKGPNAVWHSNLAAAYLAVGRLDDADVHSREALRLQPTLHNAQYNLALALLRKGRLDEAERAFRATLLLEPLYVDARCYLASVLHRQGKSHEAVALFSGAIDLSPGSLLACMGLAEVLRDLGQPTAAEPHYRAALRLSPEHAPAYYGLGLVLRDLGRTGEAFDCFQEALRLQPRHTDAQNHLGLLLLSQGRTDEAQASFQSVLRLDPNSAWALSGLSRLAAAGQYSFNSDELRQLETLACQTDRPVKERSGLHFTLARVLEQARAYDDAFAHYRQANELLKVYLRVRGAAYDPAGHSRLVDRLIAVFTPAYFERVRTYGVASDVPIFVVGMPRSGTTLTEQILASHPLARGAGELHDISHIVIKLAERLGGPEHYPSSFGQLDPAPTRTWAEEYLRQLRRHCGEAVRVVDKMPLNYQHLGVIAALFPRARIVHCRRDAIDTCLSCYFQDFSQPLPFGLDLAHLGRHYREYERLMTHYTQVLPLPLFELRYEDLISSQEEVTRRLLDFCGLDWDDRCLRFHETARTVNTSNALQVRQPLYHSSVGRWKRYKAHLAPLVEALRHDTRDG
jgi:tetratricopeptide (TPR) repeat protein